MVNSNYIFGLAGELIYRNDNGSAGWVKICPECERQFNLRSETQASEYYHGHDCEAE